MWGDPWALLMQQWDIPKPISSGSPEPEIPTHQTQPTSESSGPTSESSGPTSESVTPVSVVLSVSPTLENHNPNLNNNLTLDNDNLKLLTTETISITTNVQTISDSYTSDTKDLRLSPLSPLRHQESEHDMTQPIKSPIHSNVDLKGIEEVSNVDQKGIEEPTTTTTTE